jgi:hypothetical protein
MESDVVSELPTAASEAPPQQENERNPLPSSSSQDQPIRASSIAVVDDVFGSMDQIPPPESMESFPRRSPLVSEVAPSVDAKTQENPKMPLKGLEAISVKSIEKHKHIATKEDEISATDPSEPEVRVTTTRLSLSKATRKPLSSDGPRKKVIVEPKPPSLSPPNFLSNDLTVSTTVFPDVKNVSPTSKYRFPGNYTFELIGKILRLLINIENIEIMNILTQLKFRRTHQRRSICRRYQGNSDRRTSCCCRQRRRRGDI